MTLQTTGSASARSLSQWVYHRLRRDIIRSHWQAGSKLKLDVLVQYYEIGLSPLREALARLTGEQLVRAEDQRGFWVAPLSLEELDDISRVRSLIETEALRLSIMHGDAIWEAQIRTAFATLGESDALRVDAGTYPSASLLDTWEEHNRQFHRALVSACGSPWLLQLQQLLYHQSERYRRISLFAAFGKRFVHDEHQAIFEAALERNPLRACRLTHEHLMLTHAAVRQSMLALEAGCSAGSG